MPSRLSGVLCPVVTPFAADLSPDAKKLVTQCQWLLSQNVGLAVFGTNSEANSLSVAEKRRLLDFLLESGIDTQRMLPGTGSCALSDAVELTKHAVSLGCAGALMLPPFYYKGVSDDGLFASFAEVIERVGSSDLKIYLYHIPPVAQVGISTSLIERLVSAYPESVVGIKDSSGDWQNTQAILNLGLNDFRVFAGAETFLLQNMQAGGAGCISATANVNPAAIDRLFREWREPHASQLQTELDAVRSIVLRYPPIAALKATIAHYSGDAEWQRLRPPLQTLSEADAATMLESLSSIEFAMPGLKR